MHYDHLNEELLLEMSEIGRFEGFKICIYGGEGPVPHLHNADYPFNKEAEMPNYELLLN